MTTRINVMHDDSNDKDIEILTYNSDVLVSTDVLVCGDDKDFWLHSNQFIMVV